MKTKAIEFGGCCALGWCGSHSDTKDRGGVLISLENDVVDPDSDGEMVCLGCAERLARLLKKRVRQCRERQAQGLEYRGEPSKWRKPKVA
jgi:hypothetical protein